MTILGLGLGLSFTPALGVLGAGGAAPTLLAAPYRDDFSGAAANLTSPSARVVTNDLGDKAWAVAPDTSVSDNSWKVDGSGHLIGQQAGSYSYSVVELDTGASDRKWWRCELSYDAPAAKFSTSSNGYMFVHHSTPNPGTASSSRMQYFGGGATLQLASQIDTAGYNNASGGTEYLHLNTGAAGLGVYPHAGDTFELRQKVVGGQTFIEPYYNGQQVGPDVRIDNIAGLVLNGRLAIRGNLANAPNQELDTVVVGDPAAHALISVYCPRVPQANADGSVTVPLNGDFSGGAPSLTWTLYDVATLSAVAGYVDQPFSNFATDAAKTASSDGSWSGKCPIAAGQIGASGAYIVVKRTDVANSGAAYARTPIFTPGLVVLMYGQSLCVKMWAESTSLSFTAPAHSWTVDASLDSNGSNAIAKTAIHRKTRPVNGTLETTPSQLNTGWAAYQYNQIAGADKPMAMIRAGYGGTYYHERLPGGPVPPGGEDTIWNAMLDGLTRLAGGDVAWAWDAGGEYEAVGAVGAGGYQLSAFGSTEQAQVIADIQAIYDAVEAVTGRTVKVALRPIGAIFTGANARCEAMRRLQWKLTQDYPSRYVLGGYVMDQNHTSATDQYHFGTYSEQIRRLVYAMAKAQGLTAFDRCGPKLSSVTAWSDTSVTVRFDKNGASTLEVVNTATAITDYRGGLTFATDSGFTAEKVPTAVSAATDIDGTYAELTWTFAAGSFPTKPYVRGPYGANPFNRTGNSTVNGDIQGQASMVRGVFTGEPQNVPVQPYYSAAGDYIAGA